jgi:hypothetical protein
MENMCKKHIQNGFDDIYGEVFKNYTDNLGSVLKFNPNTVESLKNHNVKKFVVGNIDFQELSTELYTDKGSLVSNDQEYHYDGEFIRIVGEKMRQIAFTDKLKGFSEFAINKALDMMMNKLNKGKQVIPQMSNNKLLACIGYIYVDELANNKSSELEKNIVMVTIER